VKPEQEQKKKPGGQPGHQGKTRKGFGRVDRYSISQPEMCKCCGSIELSEAIKIQKQQVATLVAKPISIVEYQIQSCKCLECGAMVTGESPEGIVPGQDLSVNLQALADTRGRVELETMLGTEFAGVLSSDDFSIYNGCSVQAQQKCLAHLLRHFKKVLGLPGHNHNATVAQVFIDLINEAFQQHHLWRQHLDYTDTTSGRHSSLPDSIKL
jgi:Transposase IS66 family